MFLVSWLFAVAMGVSLILKIETLIGATTVQCRKEDCQQNWWFVFVVAKSWGGVVFKLGNIYSLFRLD